MSPGPIAILRPLWVTLGLLAGVLALFEFTTLDLALQDNFFDFETRRWLVDASAPLGRLVFYNGPKTLVWIIALTVFVLLEKVAPFGVQGGRLSGVLLFALGIWTLVRVVA